MTKKEINTAAPSAEIKAIAKAIGKSLKESGHTVPHVSMLHAVSAALNGRDWNTLRARVSKQEAAPLDVSKKMTKAEFFVGFASLLGHSIEKGTIEETRQAFIKALSGKVSGAFSWNGWNMPGDLNLESSTLDVGDFVPANKSAVGKFTVSLPHHSSNLTMEVAFSNSKGWYLTTNGAAQVFDQVEQLCKTGIVRKRTDLPKVRARMRTDDATFEVFFEANAYLAQASDSQLKALAMCGFGGCEEGDAVAIYMEGKGNQELGEAFAYLSAVQRSRRKDAPGFECYIDAPQFLHWLQAHRRDVLNEYLCDQFGVRTSEAQEKEIAGMWDWLDDQGNACECSFELEEEARENAVVTLGLFEQMLKEVHSL